VKYCKNPIRPWASSTTSSTAAALVAAGGAFEPRSQSRVAAVSPSSSITASACSWLTVSGSKPVRGTSTSPACGPLPVTTVPSTSTTAVTPTSTRISVTRLGLTITRAGPGGWYARVAIVMVIARITMDSRKCAATVHGFSPVSTVMPPSTACAGMPTNAATANGVRSRRSERSTASSVASTTAVSTTVSIRLVNSIAPCCAYSEVGTSESDVQLGQVGQPSPEPVSRTTPPVTTMPALATTDATASRRTSTSEARGSCTAPA
jgi:hypothetical protein